jgi:hypothetical protein
MCYTTSSLFLKKPSYSHFNKRKTEKKRYTQRIAKCMKSDDRGRSQGTHEKDKVSQREIKGDQTKLYNCRWWLSVKLFSLFIEISICSFIGIHV